MYTFFKPSPLQKMVKPVLTSRSVLLGELQENHFVSVVCGKGPLSKSCYVLTRSGQLCLFDDKRRLDRFTEVKVSDKTGVPNVQSTIIAKAGYLNISGSVVCTK